MTVTSGPSRLSASIRERKSRDGVALVPYITAGFPDRGAMIPTLRAIARQAAAIAIGVPFSAQMGDRVTIQRSSRVALEQGVTLKWILDELAIHNTGSSRLPPLVLMSYLNPLLSPGFARLAERCAAGGVAGIIIPDLPLEESGHVRSTLNAAGVGLVQMVTPVTPPERARRLAQATDGFLYAVTMTGVTGAKGLGVEVGDYLLGLKRLGDMPVCAGFGIRSRNNVQALAGLCDGVIVGSALIEVIERGEDPAAFLVGLL